MLERRPRHEARAAGYQLCPPDKLDTVHGITKALYWGGIVASTVFPGLVGAVGMFVAFGAGALNEGSTQEIESRDAERARVAGGVVELTDAEKKSRALWTVTERLVPMVFLRGK